MPKKVIFLDRDGTLNVDHGYVHQIDQWQWTDGAIEALKKLKEAGYALAIITNQSGIAQGMYTEDDMLDLHDHMNDELRLQGVVLDAIAYCPHSRSQTDCDCRKPNIGMAHEIEGVIGKIDYANSWTIGDKEADLLFGKNAGTKTAIIRSKYWEESKLSQQPDMVVGSLKEMVEKIISPLPN